MFIYKINNGFSIILITNNTVMIIICSIFYQAIYKQLGWL